MKAIVYTTYGSPDVLELQEVEKPTPKENELLIKVMAASVNPLDWHKMRADPFLVRLSEGLLKPKDNRLGADLAGRVEAVGRNVKTFQVGDEVFGEISVGSFAEYVCTTEDKLVLKPTNISFEETAAVPVAALTAIQSLRAKGEIQPGQKVLVNGASGGVGSFTVQLAKAFGAEVTGVCSAKNFDLVRSLGADHVVDYSKEDFTKTGQSYDFIIDNVGNRTILDMKRALTPTGKCVIVGFTSMRLLFQAILLGLLISKKKGQSLGLMSVAQMNTADLGYIKTLIEAGKVKPAIDRRYPLNEVPDAIRYLETGRARGKVVITIPQST